MTSFSNPDRRRFERIAITLPAFGVARDVFHDQIQEFSGATRDVSSGGACVVLSRPQGFIAGQEVELAMKFELEKEPIEVLGHVRWVDLGNSSTMGVEVTGMKSVTDYERFRMMLSIESTFHAKNST